MWLMTKHGFYSVVQKKPGEYHVRSRERLDLENLVHGVPQPDVEIADTPEADYACRIVTDGATVLAILAFLGRTLDYSNFKAKVDKTPDQRHKPYHEVWRVMADSLGSYGRKASWFGEADQRGGREFTGALPPAEGGGDGGRRPGRTTRAG